MNNPFHLRAFPLGYPVDFVSASEAALEAVAARYGPTPQLFDQAPLTFTIEVTEGPPVSKAVEFSSSNGDLSFHVEHLNRSDFSTTKRTGNFLVTTETLENVEQFHYHLLEVTVLTALDNLYFDPLHASCVSRGGPGLLLCGHSGAGKTTLAYACARDGWTLISEEGVHIANDGADTLSGGFWQFRLREPAMDLFPELRGIQMRQMPNGKMAIPVNACEQGFRVAWSAAPGPVVILDRRPGKAQLVPAPESEAMPYLLDGVRRVDRDTAIQRMSDLLKRGCWHMQYESLADALALLRTLA